MTQAQIDQDDEIQAIIAIAERMANRMNSSFVVDPAKLERFTSAARELIDEDHEESAE